jgi:hypothetical protein
MALGATRRHEAPTEVLPLCLGKGKLALEVASHMREPLDWHNPHILLA